MGITLMATLVLVKRWVDVLESTSMFPFFVLDANYTDLMFEGRKLYYCNAQNIIVLRSDSPFSRGYVTDPNYKSSPYYGNNTANYLVSALFEGMIGVEDFYSVSSTQMNSFMPILGHHPFQHNNPISVSKVFLEAYERNKMVLLTNEIIDEIKSSYKRMNEDLFSIM